LPEHIARCARGGVRWVGDRRRHRHHRLAQRPRVCGVRRATRMVVSSPPVRRVRPYWLL
jgi:hypothetical protein